MPGTEGAGSHGIQPLDQIMNDLGLKNHDLAAASSQQLTHKMIAKGRKGRRISRRVQGKILSSLNACQQEKVFLVQDLFTYDGGRADQD